MKSAAGKLEKLDEALEKVLDDYFQILDGRKVKNLHRLVSVRIEKDLLRYVLKRENYNQSKTSEVLGISRGSLRNKLKEYGIKLPKKK